MFELRVPISLSTAFIDRDRRASSDIFYQTGYYAGMQTTWFNVSCTNRIGFAAASPFLIPIFNWHTEQSWLLLFLLSGKKIWEICSSKSNFVGRVRRENTFFQYVGDNVDHDIATIEGLNTFHGMGLIEVSTPELPAMELSVPRKEVSGDEMKSIDTVPFYTYQKPAKSQPRTFVCLKNSGDPHDNEWKGETLRRISGFFKSLYMSWSAFMWSIH